MTARLEQLEPRQFMDGGAPLNPEIIASRGGLPIAIADFNGDDRPDLLLQRARRLELRLNDGQGGLAAQADAITLPIRLPVGFDAHGHVAAGRFTSGGEIDIVIAIGSGRQSTLTLFKNDGSGVFTRKTAEPVLLARGLAGDIQSADFDGQNGRASVVISDSGALREVRFGALGRVRNVRTLLERRGRIDAFAIGDADADGRDDIALALSAPIAGAFYRQSVVRALMAHPLGNTSHGFDSHLVARLGPGVIGGLQLADGTGDGRADVVAAAGLGVVLIPSTIGDDAFGATEVLAEFQPAPEDSLFRLRLIGVGDFNGDGLPDVAYDSMSAYNGRMYPWSAAAVSLEGQSDSAFVAAAIPSERFGYEFHAVQRGFTFIDVAGDGRPDLFSLGTGGELLMQRRYPEDWTQPPVIGSLSVSQPVLPSSRRFITAADVLDPDGTVCGVRFWFDAGPDGLPHWSVADTDGSDGWSFRLRADTYYGPAGLKRFWAQAWDEFGFLSQAVMVEVMFT